MKSTLFNITLLSVLSVVSWAAIANDTMNHQQHKMDHSQHGKMDHSQHGQMYSGQQKGTGQAYQCEMGMGAGYGQMQMKQFPPKTPKEAGQGGFAAIAEIVQILSANPDTDWSKVNINALREHLLDMDRLVTSAQVEEQATDKGMRFNVTGAGEVLRAIRNMVPAHTSELAKMPEYTATTEAIDNGVAMIINGADDKTVLKIKGLGFFGLMASGSHHQLHHLMMATGKGHGTGH